MSLFATGSFARGEASKYSDLDIFLIKDSGYQPNEVTHAELAQIHTDLFRTAFAMGFPPFSRDMEFLTVHKLEDILLVLGSPADDFYNHFTARMLLLLESSCIYNDIVYENSVSEIVRAYFRDYHDHRDDFVPLFLVNDIHRYWRTLCLNYEHNRNKVPSNPEEKNKYHVKNLKLKFSRMLTCFSAIIPLSRTGFVADPDFVRRLIKLRPFQRLVNFAEEVPSTKPLMEIIESKYMWFLERNSQPPDETREWIGDKEHREEAFGHARVFRDAMFEMLTRSVGEPNRLKLLVL